MNVCSDFGKRANIIIIYYNHDRLQFNDIRIVTVARSILSNSLARTLCNNGISPCTNKSQVIRYFRFLFYILRIFIKQNTTKQIKHVDT